MRQVSVGTGRAGVDYKLREGGSSGEGWGIDGQLTDTLVR
jgi:hypothetical protein